ncbi:MAG TPA: FKBP-type peptidyl-prolyl cis-trans isomerase [Acidimicrobiia bacterium]|nr:FKBP-type peptidyl-prolyl cis-trans isomerase [Acidimicrobiia bacterium]
MRRLLAVPLVVCFALAGAVTSAAAAKPSLADVTVSGAAGQEPTVTFDKPFSLSTSAHRQIAAGTGAKLAKGEKVTVDYVVIDGRTGEVVQSTYGKTAVGVVLDPKQFLPGFVNSLIGQSVGARELIAVAPKEGLAASIQSTLVQKTDTILFVVDVKGLRQVLKRATGTKVAPVAGLPKVKLAADGRPTIKVPKKAAPTQLVVQPLVKGTGPAVTAGQTITVHYTGVIWRNGKQFDSSWARGQPIDFAIGQGAVIAGWDEGLVGQTVGSQVLLVIPPGKGYGAQGQASVGIKGTDTLVFVVDILDAY